MASAFAEDEVPQLFSRYARAGSVLVLAAGVEGHGQGLFLSKGIVEAHGGRIWAQSPGVGRGTLVIMVLPKLLRTPSADSLDSTLGMDALNSALEA